MNRRAFLGLLGAAPFVRAVPAGAAPEPMFKAGDTIQLTPVRQLGVMPYGGYVKNVTINGRLCDAWLIKNGVPVDLHTPFHVNDVVAVNFGPNNPSGPTAIQVIPRFD